MIIIERFLLDYVIS